jgi:hypothetical protein
MGETVSRTPFVELFLLFHRAKTAPYEGQVASGGTILGNAMG